MTRGNDSGHDDFEAALDEAMDGRPERLEKLANSEKHELDLDDFDAALSEAQRGRPERLDAIVNEGDGIYIPICALLMQLGNVVNQRQ